MGVKWPLKLVAVAAWALAGVVSAGPADSVAIEDPYVRAVPPGQPNSAAFMRLVNSSGESRALVGASSPVAEVVELHTHITEDGMMKMRPVERIEVPAHGAVELQPGSFHLMLIGLKRGLAPDDPVALRLIFADESAQSFTAPVRAPSVGMMHHHHQH